MIGSAAEDDDAVHYGVETEPHVGLASQERLKNLKHRLPISVFDPVGLERRSFHWLFRSVHRSRHQSDDGEGMLASFISPVSCQSKGRIAQLSAQQRRSATARKGIERASVAGYDVHRLLLMQPGMFTYPGRTTVKCGMATRMLKAFENERRR